MVLVFNIDYIFCILQNLLWPVLKQLLRFHFRPKGTHATIIASE